jgi:hypothetical protein
MALLAFVKIGIGAFVIIRLAWVMRVLQRRYDRVQTPLSVERAVPPGKPFVVAIATCAIGAGIVTAMIALLISTS